MARYKVGDVVEVKAPSIFKTGDDKVICTILEVNTSECEGGQQVSYGVRTWKRENGQIAMSNHQTSIREMELGERVCGI